MSDVVTPVVVGKGKRIFETPAQKAVRLTKARRTIARWLCGIAAIILMNFVISPFGQFAYNGTPSMDGTLFFVFKNQFPSKGEIAAFHPPYDNLYPDAMWFGKYIVGIPGDLVSIEGRDFYINGRYIGTAKKYSSGGKKMEMSSPGVIPEGYYFVWTNHENSYDSRYADIGWIPRTNIFGRMRRIY